MNKFLSGLLCVFFIGANAQNLVLTQALYNPYVGDSASMYIIDTSAYSNGLNLSGTSGSNTAWTYTNLVATSSVTGYKYVSPGAVPASSNYPNCDIVQKAGPLNTYYNSVSTPTTQLEFLGVSSSSLTMNFTNTAVAMRYPFTFPNSYTDTFSGSFTFSVTGTASGNLTVTADGTGTLNLPNDTLTNVLRVKSSQSINFSVMGFPAGSMKVTVYDFYHASNKYPVFSVQYQTITANNNPTVTALARGNTNNFTVGLYERTLVNSDFKIYPNPASENVFISSNAEVKEIVLYNVTGEKIKTGNAQNINLQGLAPGLYYIEVFTDKGRAIKKLIKNP